MVDSRQALNRSGSGQEKPLSLYAVYCLLSTVLLLVGCAFISVPLGGPTKPLKEKVVAGEGEDKVLMIDISGVISSKEKSSPIGLGGGPSMVARVKEELEKARKDDHIKAVVLRINSPGGTVTASDIIRHEIKKFKEEKPVKVVACFTGLGTSGAYYVATSADKIVALPTSVTGSIGVILIKVNVQGLMEKVGIANETVKSGDKKDAILPLRPMTEEERQIIQGVINYLHERFIAVVEEVRPGADLKDRKELADGRVFNAQESLDLKLVDQVGYLDEAIESAKTLAGLKEARVIMYTRPTGYKDNIYSSGEGMETTSASGGLPLGMYSNTPLPFPLGLRTAGPLQMEGQDTDFMYLWQP
ncbi:MAG TPA: signal peptide peptidase SppA [Candidatus Tripitaka californicus]|uniref:signal peptide peptidase SppA n=1 Tax=Candidatus Tripitaka californicus TaxID=3367616 RepID=UPI004025A1CE